MTIEEKSKYIQGKCKALFNEYKFQCYQHCPASAQCDICAGDFLDSPQACDAAYCSFKATESVRGEFDDKLASSFTSERQNTPKTCLAPSSEAWELALQEIETLRYENKRLLQIVKNLLEST